MSIFSLVAAINFWENFNLQSIMLAVSCFAYANISIWLAYFFYRDYKQEIESSMIREYAFPYIFLSLYVLFMTELLMFIVPGFKSLVYSILFVNYYFLSAIAVGAVIYTVKPLRRLFDFYDIRVLEKAKRIAEKFSGLPEIGAYVPRTNPEIDAMLDEIWSHKEYPARQVRALEIGMCKNRIREIESKINTLETAMREDRGYEIMETLKSEREKYESLIKEIAEYQD